MRRPGPPADEAARLHTPVVVAQLLDYHRENLATIEDVLATSKAANTANEGPVYLDGAYPPPFNPPFSVVEPFTVELAPFCGYRLSPSSTAAGDRSAHRSAGRPAMGVHHRQGSPRRARCRGRVVGSGIMQVLLAQPLRPLLPYVLDPELDTAVRPIGTPNLGMVDAVRLDDRRATVVVGDNDTGVPNRVDDVSCSINDLIADEQDWRNRSGFMKHVNEMVRARKRKGLLNKREAAAIRRAAARSDVGY